MSYKTSYIHSCQGLEEANQKIKLTTLKTEKWISLISYPLKPGSVKVNIDACPSCDFALEDRILKP